MSHMQIQLLGHFVVTIDGVPIPDHAWHGRQSRALLQYLATRPQGEVSSDELIETFWPQVSTLQKRRNLRTTLRRLHRALVATGSAGEFLIPTSSGYRLSDGVQTDLMALQQRGTDLMHLQICDYEAAVEQAGAIGWGSLPVLAVEQPDAPWAVALKESIRQTYIDWQVLRADLLLGADRPEASLEALLQILELDPTQEAIAQQAMQLACQLRNPVMALRIFDRCRRALCKDLGTGPLPQTLTLHREILQQYVKTGHVGERTRLLAT